MDKHIFLIAYAYSSDGKGYIERLYIEPDAENVANFIMKHRDVKVVNINISTSLDGDEELHNHNRTFQNGRRLVSCPFRS